MKLTSYLLFDGNCHQAMNFYKSVFGGELITTTVGESPMRNMFSSNLHNRVVNARLNSGTADISASDWLHPTETPVRGNMHCLYISGANNQDTERLFHLLSEGANITDALSPHPFGLYGALNDKFGVRWMFHSANDAN